ncbi:hypothetical protein ACFSKN_02150 [Mariniflexile gromovii]|nr:hypothetical protein [Mariniflexile gromovii]
MKRNQLTYTEINANFLIRVKDTHAKKSELYSARTYVLLVGQQTANKHFLDAFNKGLDIYTVKMNNGLETNFISR